MAQKPLGNVYRMLFSYNYRQIFFYSSPTSQRKSGVRGTMMGCWPLCLHMWMASHVNGISRPFIVASYVKGQEHVGWSVLILWLSTSDYLNLFRTATPCLNKTVPVHFQSSYCLLFWIWPRLFPVFWSLPALTCICLIVLHKLCQPWHWIPCAKSIPPIRNVLRCKISTPFPGLSVGQIVT